MLRAIERKTGDEVTFTRAAPSDKGGCAYCHTVLTPFSMPVYKITQKNGSEEMACLKCFSEYFDLVV